MTTGDPSWASEARVWIDMGLRGDDNFDLPTQIEDVQALTAQLTEAGASGEAFVYRTWPDARQDEAGWSQTIEPTLLLLFTRSLQ
jgi:hypothetical protein